MLSVIRGYNILLVVLAQYLTAIFILSTGERLEEIVFDSDLFIIILSSSTAIAAGYIINNFYDSEKDLINRPQKSILDRLVSQSTKLKVYFALNFLTTLLAFYVSWRAVCFFAVYIFAIWAYSHKLKRQVLIGNIVSACLTISPFFAIFLYYKNFNTVIFVHALYLFLLVLLREITKDLENIKGDMAMNYKTIPVVFGTNLAKAILFIVAIVLFIPAFYLLFRFDIGSMKYYFYLSNLLTLLFVWGLWTSNSKVKFLILHNILKFNIVAGVVSIPLVDTNLPLESLNIFWIRHRVHHTHSIMKVIRIVFNFAANCAKLSFIFFLTFSALKAQSQIQLTGEVYDLNSTYREPLVGANIYWLEEQMGTITDAQGHFTIPYKTAYKKLIISYVGYRTDTLTVTSAKHIKHGLKSSEELKQIDLTVRKKLIEKSYIKSQNTVNITSKELLKAACCNLAESFETNPSIDVGFTDAVYGTKQIELLGLTSPYIVITAENLPIVRGASQAFGLSFIPGTWIESIQLTKGAGSVINGFESITGQINVELQKPSANENFFINSYAALNGRLELNTHLQQKISDQWSTGFYIHGNLRDKENDRNADLFLDMPLQKQVNIANRWQYSNLEKGYVSFLNLRLMKDDKQAGQIDFDPKKHRLEKDFWGSEIKTKRLDLSAKLGKVNPEIPWRSIGFQLAYSYHDQESYFGFNQYEVIQYSYYSNIIYNSIITNTKHKIKTGLSYTYDEYDEFLDIEKLDDNYDRNEQSIGGFFEYSYDNLKDLSLSAGLRIDHHNLLDLFITPRLHLRYSPWGKSAFRLSIGRGKRSANIFVENQHLFASSRGFSVIEDQGNIYGLDPEIAWNFGLSYLQGFNFLGSKGDFVVDFYKTIFSSQVVVDIENPRQVIFYNSKQNNFSNSLQLELNYDLFNKIKLRTAYKLYEIKTNYHDYGKLRKPLTPKHRFFVNLSYETLETLGNQQWKFDMTYKWVGEQRLPPTDSNPLEFRLEPYSPSFYTLSAQVTKIFSNSFEIYVGGENITDYKQRKPIVSASQPFSPHFDSSIVYAPINGSNFYMGLRFKK